MTHDPLRSSSVVSRRAALAGLGSGGLGLALVSAGLTGAQEATPATAAAANTRLVERLVAAIGAGDSSGMDDLLSPDYVQHQPGVPPGREGFKQFIIALGPTPLQILHTVAEGDLVVVHSVIPGVDPAATPERELLDLFRVANGRVAEHWGAANVAPGAATPSA
jgi:predicted SnoaL-like aldol condensation-catalyzing enzyme